MARVPGRPDSKRAMLVGLDEKSLPYLAADILSECFKHTDVQVSDGPGDGKRDVHSTTPAGKPCASQCKFHEAPGVAVGSRETDELPIALLKFGARDGYFFTTGRISPQARREFLDNFPDFTLHLVDGTELVDLVLSSPALASAWLEGETIGAHARRVGIVVVARDAATDSTLAVGRVIGDMPDARSVAALVPTGVLAPYRAPVGPTLDEIGATVWATLVFPDGPFGLQLAARAKEIVLTSLRAAIGSRPAGTAWLVRFGAPVVAPKALPDNFMPVYLPGQPETFVVTCAGIAGEHEFLVPDASTGWSFPKDVSMLDSDWASWMSHDLDVWFRVHVPDAGSHTPVFAWMAAQHRARLDASLFASGPKAKRKRLLSLLGPSGVPSVECAYGPGGVLLGWFHPDVSTQTFELMPSGTAPAIPVARAVPEHDAAMALVREALAQVGFEVVQRTDAEAIVHLAGAEPLVPFTTEAPEHYSAKLALRYDEVPSPLALNQRKCMFVSWWRVPLPPKHAKAAVERAVRDAKPLRVTYHELKLAPRWKQPVAMITLCVPSPVDLPSGEILNASLPSVAETLASIETSLRSLAPDARLASRWFWDSEIRS